MISGESQDDWFLFLTSEFVILGTIAYFRGLVYKWLAKCGGHKDRLRRKRSRSMMERLRHV